MAKPFYYVNTELPEIPDLDYELREYSPNKERCSSKSFYLPATHWLGGFIWFYMSQINNANYKYDIRQFDFDKLWCHIYEPGSRYQWHVDAGLQPAVTDAEANNSQNPSPNNHLISLAESSRKLAFSLQLTDPSEYTGGDLQFLTEPGLNLQPTLLTAPKTKGTIVVFDPRIQHRVTRIRSGMRKSIVGWAIGPRWR